VEEGPIDRRAPWTDQGHEEDWCLLEKLVRSLKTAVAHFSSTSVDEDQQRNDAPQSRHEETKRRSAPRRNATNSATKRRNETAQTAQQNSANGATKRRKQRNETVFAPSLQHHRHNRYDRNERHEQRQQPLN